MRVFEVKLSEFATMTAYLHEADRVFANIEAFHAMLVLPGGGFRFCSPREGEPIAMAYYAKGYQAFVLDYTTVTKKPDAVMADPMEDVRRALLHIREHAEEYLLDPKKVAMIGFSGGSHLAAAVSTHGPERPDLLLLGYPGIIHSDLRALDCPDIVECVDEKTPASFVFVTRNDTVTPPKHALAFINAMDACGNDYELHIFKDGPHGLSLANAFTAAGEANQVNLRFAQWFDLSVQWLTMQFGEYTIYGVNDGRNTRYNIDKNVAVLMENEQIWQMTCQALPMLPGILAMDAGLKSVSLRAMSGFMPLDKDALMALDAQLVALG